MEGQTLDAAAEEQFLRKGSSIDADVLFHLMDGNIHTLQELANKVETSQMTIRRSIERLGISFIIHTFTSGISGKRGGGGVYLDEQHLYFGLTRDSVTKKRREKLKGYKVRP